MSILRNVKVFPVFLIISMTLVSLTTSPPTVYCDDWVCLDREENDYYFYKPSSVKIDNHNNTIKVWVKTVLTEKGKIIFFKNKNSNEKQKFIDINDESSLFIIHYKEMKCCIINIIIYSKSGSILSNTKYPCKMEDIPPDSRIEVLLNQLLKDYDIQK